VTVSRGEIRGNTTITVPQLSVRFAPRLVVPGERATVVVTREGDSVENASVMLGGEHLGTTGPNGTVSFGLPPSVGGTVTAAVGPQTATVPPRLAYWLPASLTLVVAFLTVLTTAVTGYWRGREATKRLAYGWAGVWTLYVGYVVGERLGLGIAAVAVLLVVLYRYRRTLASGGTATAGLLAGFLQWCSSAVLWVVGALIRGCRHLRLRRARVPGRHRSGPRGRPGLVVQAPGLGGAGD